MYQTTHRLKHLSYLNLTSDKKIVREIKGDEYLDKARDMLNSKKVDAKTGIKDLKEFIKKTVIYISPGEPTG